MDRSLRLGAGTAAFVLCGLEVRRRTRHTATRAVDQSKRDAAIALGRQADRLRYKKLSKKDQLKVRQEEVYKKMQVLKGKMDRASRYIRQRDAEREDGKSSQDDQEPRGDADGDYDDNDLEGADDDDDNDDDGDVFGSDSGKGSQKNWQVYGEKASSGPKTAEQGAGPAEWAFKSDDRSKRIQEKRARVSEESRAVLTTELAGKSVSSAKQLVAAAKEFVVALEFAEAAELYEIARTRIDKEQIDRKLNLYEAQSLDDECTWELAKAYRKSGRLTLAFDRYGQLKARLPPGTELSTAIVLWAQVAAELAERLYTERRFQDALAVLEAAREATLTGKTSFSLRDEVELSIAMTLQELKRTDEAQDVLLNIRALSSSQRTKQQATFVLDVITAPVIEERNEEFHKMWENNFKVGQAEWSEARAVRAGTGSRATAMISKLSQGEREFRTWATQYWEERLKSPIYYACLTLWVTWPFAIPVVSIMRKSGMML